MSSLTLVNLECLLIIDFFKVLEDNKLEILDVNHNKSKKYTGDDLKLLSEHWKLLFDEFYALRKDKSGRYMMDKNYELSKLYFMLQMLYEYENRAILLIELERKAELTDFVVKRTKELIVDFGKIYPRVKINIFSNPIEVLEIIQSVIKSQTNIFDEKTGAKEKVVEKQKQSVHKIVAQMSRSLGFSLDVSKMTCLEFISYEELILDSNSKN